MPKHRHSKVIVETMAITKHWLNTSEKAAVFDKSVHLVWVERQLQKLQLKDDKTSKHLFDSHLSPWLLYPPTGSFKFFCTVFHNYLYIIALHCTCPAIRFPSVDVDIVNCPARQLPWVVKSEIC